MLSVWQIALIGAMLAAFWFGKPTKRIMGVMVSNLCASVYLGGNFSAVMVVDLLCVAVLIGRGPIEDFLALLFALMIPLYIPAVFGAVSASSTFAIVEVLTYTQYAIIGGLGGGIINRCFRRKYRRLRNMGIDPVGGYAACAFRLGVRPTQINELGPGH